MLIWWTLGLWWSAALAPLSIGALLATGRRPSERTLGTIATLQGAAVFVGGAGLAWLFLRQPQPFVEVPLAPLLEHHGYEWRAVLLVDRLSVAYVGLAGLIGPVVVRFSLPAFHREPGAHRYWFLVTLFLWAFLTTVLGGNIDVLYLGWELVGVCSVMLIAFFRHNPRSAHNSLRALVYYRLSDLGLLGAAVWMHHALPSSDFTHFAEDSVVPSATLVGLLLLFGSLAKSAQLPMSPWLHRAMEGPAASSAIFYGALSVHLGPMLLVRTAPLWMPHPAARAAIVVEGLLTALFAAAVGRTRPDAKTALAYATMTQLGLMLVETGLGWHRLVVVHAFAHAGLRAWQFLRSSSLIQDFQQNPLVTADLRSRHRSGWERLLPAPVRGPLYLAAMRLFWLDALHAAVVVGPLQKLWGGLERLEEALLPGAADEGDVR